MSKSERSPEHAHVGVDASKEDLLDLVELEVQATAGEHVTVFSAGMDEEIVVYSWRFQSSSMASSGPTVQPTRRPGQRARGTPVATRA